jgi:hypothetical protein
MRCVLFAAFAGGVAGALGPELQTLVSTSASLLSALGNTAVARMVLAPGTYYLNAELRITRSLVIEAAVSGTVVLNAQASSSSQRRVLLIDPGSSGVVQLIGLNITGGHHEVRVQIFHRPDGKVADALALILACTTANASPSVNYSM